MCVQGGACRGPSRPTTSATVCIFFCVQTVNSWTLKGSLPEITCTCFPTDSRVSVCTCVQGEPISLRYRCHEERHKVNKLATGESLQVPSYRHPTAATCESDTFAFMVYEGVTRKYTTIRFSENSHTAEGIGCWKVPADSIRNTKRRFKVCEQWCAYQYAAFAKKQARRRRNWLLGSVYVPF